MPRTILRKAVRRRGSGLSRFLGELELDVLRVVWRRGQATVAEVRVALSLRRPLAYTTVMTVMVRLFQKGLLRRAKRGRAYMYSPTKTREEVVASLAGDVAHALLADFGDVAIAQFVKEVGAVDREALARLADLAREELPDG